MRNNPDPINEAVSLLDYKEQDLKEILKIDEDHIEGVFIPKIEVVLHTASDKEVTLTEIEEPKDGKWKIEKI